MSFLWFLLGVAYFYVLIQIDSVVFTHVNSYIGGVLILFGSCVLPLLIAAIFFKKNKAFILGMIGALIAFLFVMRPFYSHHVHSSHHERGNQLPQVNK